MISIGVLKSLPVDDPNCFVARETDKPRPSEKQLLVRVKAVSVNPVDVKRRQWKKDDGLFSVLGWDVSGTVEETGSECELFKPGDDVYFAGSVSQPGANAEFHTVDERIAGRKPSNLSHAEAAALPLTSITAWEAMFERMCISTDPAQNKGKSILLIGSAGGVGSIASQLASHFGLNVLGTASRSESESWARAHGVDIIIRRNTDIVKQLEDMGFDFVDYIFCMNSIEEHWNSIVNAVAPLGRICSIVSSRETLDMSGLWNKSASFSWEFMSTRPNFSTKDMITQHEILEQVGELVEQKKLRSTMNLNLGSLSVQNLCMAHEIIESGKAVGKIVMESIPS